MPRAKNTRSTFELVEDRAARSVFERMESRLKELENNTAKRIAYEGASSGLIYGSGYSLGGSSFVLGRLDVGVKCTGNKVIISLQPDVYEQYKNPALIFVSSGGSTVGDAEVQLLRNGLPVRALFLRNEASPVAPDTAVSLWLPPQTLTFFDYPPAGAHRYGLKFVFSGPGVSLYVNYSHLEAYEL